MAYAGICGADDLQAHSDPYFHTVSFDEIVAYTTTAPGNTCGVQTATGNSLPVPSVPAGGYTIPKLTPFALTGSATDANGDSLTYNWEEFDLGPAGSPSATQRRPSSVRGTRRPARRARSRGSTSCSPTRRRRARMLPNVTKTLNFRMTVRDNRAGGGGVAYATHTV